MQYHTIVWLEVLPPAQVQTELVGAWGLDPDRMQLPIQATCELVLVAPLRARNSVALQRCHPAAALQALLALH